MQSLKDDEIKFYVIEQNGLGLSASDISSKTGIGKSTITDFLRKETWREWWALNGDGLKQAESIRSSVARVLIIDIETTRLLFGGWGMFNQNFSIDQIEEDWELLSYSAKWMDDDEVMYSDITEKSEKEILEELHSLFNEADFMIAHNGRRFDLKKIRARMIINGLTPHSPVRVIDTLEIAKKEFGFTSNKLQYLTQTLCKSKVKSAHGKFPGYLLWKEFLKGNQEAIDEMRDYNIIDVESLEELYLIIAPWSNSLPNFDIYNTQCVDMSVWEPDGYHCSNLGKYERFRHKVTGQYRRGRKNLLSKEKREQLLANIV